MPASTPTIAQRLAQLRVPFDPAEVGKLPKPYKRDSAKGQCRECGGYHGLPAVHLDYVGHAALTNRMLEVDPEWTWEPFALDANGLPAVVNGNLWIRLTICGVTRIGVGDAEGGSSLKVMIGDALRNAGMRFGMALDLWSKEDLHDFTRAQGTVENPPEDIPASVRQAPQGPSPAEERLRNLDVLTKDINALSQADRAEYLASWKEAKLPKLGQLNEKEYTIARRMMDLLKTDIGSRTMALDPSLGNPASAPDYAEPGNEYYEGGNE